MSKLLWADIETTGLNPKEDLILAVGLVVTDANLRVVDSFERVVAWNASELFRRPISSVVMEMHTKSGLFDKSLASTSGLFEVELSMLEFVKENFKDDEKVLLAGSSVHFDRSFFAGHMPDFYDTLYHRQVDVSSLKVLVGEWAPDLKFYAEDPKHTPLMDIYGSIEELRHYKKMLF
jgi:oligoribonuclease